MRLARVALAVTAVVSMISITAACSSNSDSKSESKPTTFEILSILPAGSPQAAVQATVVSAFEQQTGVKVKVTTQTKTIDSVYETSVAGGKEPDVVLVNLAGTTPTWVKAGIVIPASKYLKAWGLQDKIMPEALKEWTDASGQVQGFPYSGFIWPVWYNMELLGKAGITSVPKTTSDLLEDVAKLKTAGIAPFIVGGGDWSGNKLFLQIAQSYMTPDDATNVLTKGGFCSNADAMKGINLFTQLRDAGMFPSGVSGYTADQMNAAFYQGKAAMMSAGSWALGPTPKALQSKVQLGGFPIPADGNFKKPTAYQAYTSTGFWISPKGDKPNTIDLTRKFIEAWYEPDIAAAFVKASTAPVAALSVGKLENIPNKIEAQAFNTLPEQVDFAVFPDINVPGNLADASIRGTTVAFEKNSSAQKICTALDSSYPK